MKATFAEGCFWHVEEVYRHLPGVLQTTVGFTGGTTKNPTYAEVCRGHTGHAEAVLIEYDPRIITYEQLLKIFWESHDPTTLNQQGPDIGSQYRSAIFFHDDSQRIEATRSKIEEQKKHSKTIVTEITSAEEFYSAEEYHQRYFEKNGLSHCNIVNKKNSE